VAICLADRVVLMDWLPEPIPDEDRLYHRVHKTWIKPGRIEPAAFQNSPRGSDSMSVDWAKYATPQETRARAKKPIENAVIQLEAGLVRAVPGQKVEHSPSSDNRSHSDVIGEKNPQVRIRLSRLYTLVIPLEQRP